MASLMKLVATRAPLGLVTPRLMRGLCGCSHRLGAAAEARETKGAFTSNLPGSSDVETQPGTSMRALVKRHREKGLWLEDVEIPKMGPMDVLIQIKSASLCGTDVHIYNWDDWAAQTVPAPMRIGHEWGGVIVEKGSAVKSLQVGQRVTGEGHIACGTCRNCRAGTQHLCRDVLGVGVTHPGAFCDFFSLPATNVFPLPDEIDFKYASIMDPLGNAVHCALAFDLVGEDVLITGAGPIGAMAAAVCKFVGARHVVVTDINDYRLDLAKQCGADVVVNVSDNSEERLQAAMSELGMSEGFDIALEMSGVEDGYTQLLSSMNHGGRVAILGIPSRPIAIDWNMVVFKGLSLKGIYGREMYETWYKMSNMLVAGLDKQIAPVITHQLDFEDFQEAFDIMLSGQSGKVVLNLND